MSRPQDKMSLLEQSESKFKLLFDLIDSLSIEDQQGDFNFDDRDKNIRDVLIHLYEWHQLLLKWVSQNKHGFAARFLPEPYNWKTYPAMNIAFWKKHQSTSLSTAKLLLERSHSHSMQLVKEFSDDELFLKRFFKWTGSTTLGSYCVSSMSSHYDRAIKKVKKYKRSLLM